MEAYQSDFIDFIIEQEALLFGDFTLKSGKQSPYFFNAGAFKTGAALAQLGRFYADAIVASGIEYDMLFGPAYKGIPLVSTVAIALAEHHGIDKPFCFNRKEAKAHGEGGVIVGAELKGRVLLIDDVITKGTAFGEAKAIIDQHDAEAVGLMISLDRQEKNEQGMAVLESLAKVHGVQINAIVDIDQVVKSLFVAGRDELALPIQTYLNA